MVLSMKSLSIFLNFGVSKKNEMLQTFFTFNQHTLLVKRYYFFSRNNNEKKTIKKVVTVEVLKKEIQSFFFQSVEKIIVY